MNFRVIAIDWSGAVQGATKKIWLAEVADGVLARLESGRDRDEIAAHLEEHADHYPNVVIGLDFAFSLPAWYLRAQGWASVQELWAVADRDGDALLRDCEPPFWGKPGKGKPGLEGAPHFRQTELNVPITLGIKPKSVFQVGGAGAVGTGSLRGMRLLHRLSAAGFSIWPFDSPGWPRVVEIYPRLLTGPVIKTNADARRAYLATHYPGLGGQMAELAASGEDAFDAAVSALVMSANLPDLVALSTATDDLALQEGLIWHPARNAAVARSMPSG